MACSVCGAIGHNSRTCESTPRCEGCGERITTGGIDFNGEPWHQDCFEV